MSSKSSKRARRKRHHTRPLATPQSQGRSSKAQPKKAPSWTLSKQSWLYIGIVGAVLVIAVLAVWFFTNGPGQRSAQSMPAAPVDRQEMYSAAPEMQIDISKSYVATISTARGSIVAVLDASAAPRTVNNFVFLARQGFYDGLTFHRVEPGFVIQGGDPLGTGGGGPGYTVPAEIGLPHVEGAIAMARRGDDANPERASSGSQFYITLAPTSSLDGAYTVFGHVTQGMDVVQSIAIGDVIETITITERQAG